MSKNPLIMFCSWKTFSVQDCQLYFYKSTEQNNPVFLKQIGTKLQAAQKLFLDLVRRKLYESAVEVLALLVPPQPIYADHASCDAFEEHPNSFQSFHFLKNGGFG